MGDLKKDLEAAAKKAANAASTAAGKIGDAGSFVVKGAGEGAKAAAEGVQNAIEKVQEEQEQKRLSKLNPIFPDEYNDLSFDMPKTIVVADGDIRKGEESCKGAIGWLNTSTGMEVLYLYEDMIKESGIRFFPAAERDCVYYVDPFDERRYVDLSHYFEIMQQDKNTELRQIAYLLGAKWCSLDMYEATQTKSLKAGKLGATATSKGTLDAEGSYEAERTTERHTLFTQVYEGDAKPVVPELQWYANDKEITFLISTRCNEGKTNSLTDYCAIIDNATSATMNMSLAGKLDAACSELHVGGNLKLAQKSKTESQRKLKFEIKF